MIYQNTNKPSLLFIGHEFRYPTQTGSHVRISNLIKLYSEKFSVHLIVPKFVSSNQILLEEFYKRYVTELYVIGEKYYDYKNDNDFLSYLIGPKTVLDFNATPYIHFIRDTVINKKRFDIIHVERWFMTNIVKNDLNKNLWAKYYLLDFDASDYTFRKQLSKLFTGHLGGKLKSSAEPWRVRLWEYKYLSKFDAVFIASQKELNELRTRTGNNNLLLVKNGYNLPATIYEDIPSEQSIILFVGTLNYLPNISGFNYFVNNVWPLIRQKLPNIVFWHVGSCPDHIIKEYEYGNNGISFKGFVENLSSLYQIATVIAIPLFQGNGTRIKLLEAASYGKPIVATRFAAEDLGFCDNMNIVYADDHTSMAAKCIELLLNKEYRSTIGANAAKHVSKNYSWKRIGQEMYEGIERLLPFSIYKNYS